MNDYQIGTQETWSGKAKDIRSVLGLVGEAGEIAECHKKYLRGDYDGEAYRDKMLGELGDALYYVAVCALEHGYKLSEVAEANYDKLKSRKQRGVIKGSGDDR